MGVSNLVTGLLENRCCSRRLSGSRRQCRRRLHTPTTPGVTAKLLSEKGRTKSLLPFMLEVSLLSTGLGALHQQWQQPPGLSSVLPVLCVEGTDADIFFNKNSESYELEKKNDL